MELNPDFLHVIFAKKQDYEPMAIPTGFAVLDDLNRNFYMSKYNNYKYASHQNFHYDLKVLKETVN